MVEIGFQGQARLALQVGGTGLDGMRAGRVGRQ